jgi:hypothetical protein
MVSLFDQLKLKPETDFRLIHWGKFFFLGIGILYLMGVGWGFAKSIPQISDIFLSWTLIVVGGSGIGTIFSSKNKLLPIKFTPDTVFSIMLFLCILIIGLLFLGRQILEQRIGAEMWTNLVTYLSIGFIISLFPALLFVMKSQKKTKYES